MKIIQLLSGLDTVLSNEEQSFFKTHDQVRISSLDERNQWLAQNLVRRGLYTISKDNNTLTKTSK